MHISTVWLDMSKSCFMKYTDMCTALYAHITKHSQVFESKGSKLKVVYSAKLAFICIKAYVLS